jgi:hypothetical protein
VYKLRRALYGLNRHPGLGMVGLRGFLLAKGFEMGKVDQTLFSLGRALIF